MATTIQDPLWGVTTGFINTKEYPEAAQTHDLNTLRAQTQGAILLSGAGVAAGFGVTAGSGLDVNIAAGIGSVISPSFGPVTLQTFATVNRAGFAANTTSYLFAAIDVTAGVNDSRETRAPVFVISGSNTMPDGLLLATVTATASTVSVTLPPPKSLNATTLNNQGASYYLDRANHTGTQLAATISDFTEASQDVIGALLVDSADIDFTYNDAGNAETVVLTPTGIAAGTYQASSFAIDAKGRITAAAASTRLPIVGYNSANGQDFKLYQTSELLTIAAAATTQTAGQIPAGATVRSVSLRVVTAIPTATTFDIGVTGATTRYGAALSSAAGTTGVSGGTNSPSCYAAATNLLITPNATPSAATGQVRVTWYYDLATAPTS